MTSKRKIIIFILFIPLGFLCAVFIFKLLTKQKSPALDIQTTPLTTIEKETLQAQATLDQPSQTKEEKLDTDIVSKDDTQTEVSEVTDVAEKEIEIPPLMLKGIYYSKEGGMALINDHILKEGDLILGVKVLRIYPRRVEMDLDGYKFDLRSK